MKIYFVRHGHPDFTSITVIEFSDKLGERFCPRVLLLNDARHIEGLNVNNL